MKNLILHIEQIKDKNFFHDFEEKPEAFPVLSEMIQNHKCEFIEPLKIHVRAFRIRELFEVEGTLQTRVSLQCSRCLKKFDTPLQSDFALTYTKELPAIAPQSDAEETELWIEEIGLMYFRGEEINLRKGIQEQVVMAFPVKPLCDQACKGLCSRCGADLNKGDCGCSHEPVTNKFGALKDLKLNKK